MTPSTPKAKAPVKSRMTSKLGDAAVLAKTGKDWNSWFTALDKAGAKKMSHKEIVAMLSSDFGLPGWWRQMVAVTYEQERGLRKPHEKPDGYEISVSKTIAASADALYKAWKNPGARSRWLPETVAISSETKDKSIRMVWSDGKSRLDVQLYPKGASKCQIVVQHRKLPTSAAAAKMKKFWAASLGRLEESVN